MKITQISVFLENQPGRLTLAAKTLADANIDIRTLSFADTSDFGILRLLLDEPERGLSILEKANFTVKATEVVAVEVPDSPGGLAKVLGTIAQAQVSIEYMYAYTRPKGENAVMIFCFDNNAEVIALLEKNGLNLLSNADLKR